MRLRIAIVTCSDTRTLHDDTAGAAIAEACAERGWEVASREIAPDERGRVSKAIVAAADEARADIVLTTGGTGFGPRDVTPEATEDACDRLAPGIAEAIRAFSLEVTPRAMLSRGTAGIRGTTLVVNLPGSEKGASESFGFVADQFEHAVEMMAGGGH